MQGLFRLIFHVSFFLAGAAFALSAEASSRAEWRDVSRSVVQFGDLEELLTAAEPLLSPAELEQVRVFLRANGLTIPFQAQAQGGVGLIHRTRVLNVSVEEASRYLVGPATGEGGYAASFLSETPQAEQIGQGGVLARDARLPGVPTYFASDARGVKLTERIVVTWIQGRAAQGFSIHVLSAGSEPMSSEFVEIGYYIAEARAKSVFDVPGAFAVRLAERTVGRPIQVLASRAIAEIHMDRMNVSHSVATRIERERCRSALAIPSGPARIL